MSSTLASVPAEGPMGNKASHSESEDAAAAAAAAASSAGTASSSASRPPQSRRTAAAAAAADHNDDGEEPLVEVPPPMQPISSIPLSEDMANKVRVFLTIRQILCSQWLS